MKETKDIIVSTPTTITVTKTYCDDCGKEAITPRKHVCGKCGKDLCNDCVAEFLWEGDCQSAICLDCSNIIKTYDKRFSDLEQLLDNIHAEINEECVSKFKSRKV